MVAGAPRAAARRSHWVRLAMIGLVCGWQVGVVLLNLLVALLLLAPRSHIRSATSA